MQTQSPSTAAIQNQDRAAVSRVAPSPFALAMLGGLALWLALPPVEWWPLAWLAPVIWTPLVTRPSLAGRRPYLKLWLAGYLFWSAGVYWIMLPHWTAKIGWFFLAAYMGLYFPAFFAASRLAVHRLRVPAEIAMPVVWTALELVRAYALNGFLMAALGHTQYRWLELIQLSDLVGAYGVSFLVMFVGVCAYQAAASGGRARWVRAAAAVLALAGAIGYGRGRLAVAPVELAAPAPKIALIQGTLDTVFGQSFEEFRQAKDETYAQYLRLSRDAVARHPDMALVVWPESMYRRPLVTFHDGVVPEYMTENIPRLSRELIYDTLTQVGVPMLIAVNAEDHSAAGAKYFNTSLHVTFDEKTGQPAISARYDKMHLVPFGEFVFFGDWFPWLYRLTPLEGGLTPGETPVAVPVGTPGTVELLAAPSICFETVLPHVMRRQILELRDRQREPHVLVTQTNDGWFWGAAGLDMHLVCDVFRAVEFRKPLVAAANTGLSAWIDDRGRIIEQLPRRTEGYIVATPLPSALESPYLAYGDWFAYACAAMTVLFVVAAALKRKP